MRGPTCTQRAWPTAADGAKCKEVGAARSPRAASAQGGVAHTLHAVYLAYERPNLKSSGHDSASCGHGARGDDGIWNWIVVRTCVCACEIEYVFMCVSVCLCVCVCVCVCVCLCV